MRVEVPVDRIVYVDKIVEKHVNVPVPVPGPPQMIDRPVPVGRTH
jgi:hypothetical protein